MSVRRRIVPIVGRFATLLGAVLVTLPTPCFASSPCGRDSGRPIRVAVVGPADLGVLPEACEATEASLEARAAVLVAMSDLYGSLQTGLGARGRLVLAERTWLSLWTPSLDYRFVANASVEADRLSMGGSVLGLHHRLPLGERVSIAPFVRLLLPTDMGFVNATRWGGDQGISAAVRWDERLELVGGYAFAVTDTVIGARSLSLLTESVSADIVYRPWRALAFAGGAGLRFALADRRPFESFDPRLSVRVYPFRGLFIVLGSIVPLWGRDRTDVGLALSIGYGDP